MYSKACLCSDKKTASYLLEHHKHIHIDLNNIYNFRHPAQSNRQDPSQIISYVPPGVQINQLMCSDRPGDSPVVQFINVLDPLKLPPRTTVTMKSAKVKLQVKV